MEEQRWKVLIIGQLPEADAAFSAPSLREHFTVEPTRLGDGESIRTHLESHDYDLVVLDSPDDALEHLESLHRQTPAVPVLLVADPDAPGIVVEGKRSGLDDYLFRIDAPDCFPELLAQKIHTLLESFSEPPSTIRPTATDLHRYAQYFNVIHPFFVIDGHHILRYANGAAIKFVDQLCDRRIEVGEDIGHWPLEGTAETFRNNLERALAGEPTVSHRSYQHFDSDTGFRELFYQPVRARDDRIVAVSLAIHTPSNPELKQARRLQTVGQLAAGVAHDFNNLLGIITTSDALMRARLDQLPEAVAEFYEAKLDQIERTVERGANLTRQLLSFSKRETAEAEEMDLNATISAIKPLLESLVGEDVRITTRFEESLPTLRGNRAQIEQVLMNLVANARDAMPTGGELTIETETTEFDEATEVGEKSLAAGTFAVMKVTDTGGGIDEEAVGHIFDPFFTTKGAEGGTGLGLAMVNDIVTSLDGAIHVSSRPGDGTTFKIYLPTCPGRSATTDGPTVADAADRGTVWLVEDEPDLRESLAELLEMHDYAVVTASDYEDARRTAETLESPPDVLMTDVVMPGKSGLELAGELRELWPTLDVVLLSGYSSDALDRYDGLPIESVRLLNKPITPEKLFNCLDEIFERTSVK